MPKAVVNIITIVVITGLYLFLFWVARSMRAHLGRPAAHAVRHDAIRPERGQNDRNWAM